MARVNRSGKVYEKGKYLGEFKSTRAACNCLGLDYLMDSALRVLKRAGLTWKPNAYEK